MGENKRSFDEVSDSAGAGGNVLEGAPALREQGEVAFSKAAQRRVAGAGAGVGKQDYAWYGSCLAKVHAEAGEAAAAAVVSLPIVADVVELNRHATKELVDVATLLTRRKVPQAAESKEALMAGSTDH
ncbi:hypothetical protein ABT061_27810 [Streptosporangium sp. NPDC002544]|uniref:hypothetical protein n=1 Tax=Streptosporangium sp. NPDC002544 TaxID=3154538 RepID=UPI00332FC323